MVLYMAIPLNQSKEDCLFSFNNQLPLTTRLPWSACGLKNNLLYAGRRSLSFLSYLFVTDTLIHLIDTVCKQGHTDDDSKI